MATDTNAVVSPVVIQVRFDRVYGNLVCYPVNDAAHRVASIARTKTLSRDNLRLVGELGHLIEASDTSVNVLREWLA